MQQREWYVRRASGATVGPVSTELVIKGMRAGKVAPGDWVCPVGEAQFRLVSAEPTFAGASGPALLDEEDDAKTRVFSSLESDDDKTSILSVATPSSSRALPPVPAPRAVGSARAVPPPKAVPQPMAVAPAAATEPSAVAAPPPKAPPAPPPAAHATAVPLVPPSAAVPLLPRSGVSQAGDAEDEDTRVVGALEPVARIPSRAPAPAAASSTPALLDDTDDDRTPAATPRPHHGIVRPRRQTPPVVVHADRTVPSRSRLPRAARGGTETVVVLLLVAVALLLLAVALLLSRR